MFAELMALGIPAVSIGFVHCICGPDHYVPFVAMSRVGLWSLRKTLFITVLCGIGHVLGSAVIGFIGIGLGLIVWQLQAQAIESTLGDAESIRGDLAGWMLLGFGVIYTVWGLYRAMRKSESQSPGRADLVPNNQAAASDGQADPTAAPGQPGRLTPWVLFTVFLFGPCEPLIPMLMVPASQKNMLGVAWITFLFGLTTLLTMTTLVALIYMGAFAVRFPRLQTWGHAMAGSVVALCGAAVLTGL